MKMCHCAQCLVHRCVKRIALKPARMGSEQPAIKDDVSTGVANDHLEAYCWQIGTLRRLAVMPFAIATSCLHAYNVLAVSRCSKLGRLP